MASLTGELQNGLGGTLVVNLTGADSAINGNIHDLNVEQGGDGTTTLNLTNGAQWNFDKDSSVTTLEAKQTVPSPSTRLPPTRSC